MDERTPLADVMITLGARDFESLRDFYRRVGWPEAIEAKDFIAFDVHGVVLALFPRDKLASDGRTQPDPGDAGIRFTVGIMLDSADEVDQLTERMRHAGARVTKEPVDAEFFEGRSAYLCDPEGNYFELVWSPPNNPITQRRRPNPR